MVCGVCVGGGGGGGADTLMAPIQAVSKLQTYNKNYRGGKASTTTAPALKFSFWQLEKVV